MAGKCRSARTNLQKKRKNNKRCMEQVLDCKRGRKGLTDYEKMARPHIENGWDGPRISFSFNLSQTDRTSREKPKRDVVCTIGTTEFEFCRVSNCVADSCKTLSYADELFVDGKILPPIRSREPQPKSITRHTSLENSRRPSRVRFLPFPASKRENAAAKSASKPSVRWKDYYFCALPFSRCHSTGERKPKPCSDAPCYRTTKSLKEKEISKPFETAALKSATKVPAFPKRKGSVTKDLSSSHVYARNYGPERKNGRFMERYNPKAFDSLRPGKLMAEGLVNNYSNSNISGVNMQSMNIRVSPALNAPIYIGPFGGMNGPGLFGLSVFCKRESRRSLHSASAGYIDR